MNHDGRDSRERGLEQCREGKRWHHFSVGSDRNCSSSFSFRRFRFFHR